MRRGTGAIALTGLLAVSLVLGAGLVPSSEAAYPPEGLLITSGSAGAERRFEAFDTAKHTLYDIDGDGTLEIVTHNDNNRVYVIDSVTGKVRAELETRYPSSWKARELTDIAVADVDGNGLVDLVVPNSAAVLTRFEHDPNASANGRLAFRKVWDITVDASRYQEDFWEKHPWIKPGTRPGLDGGPYLADVDGDGKMEIFVQTDDFPGHFSFDSDGELRWVTTWADGNGNPWVLDLDGDGKLEAVFVSDGGRVYVYNAKSGSVRWVFDARKHGSMPGSISVSPAVADLDGDGKREIVFGTRQAVEDKADPDWMDKQHARFYALADGHGKPRLLWNVTYDWMNPHTYTHPVIVDVDGDGHKDVLTMDWNTIGHKPGSWEITGKANIFALDGRDGSLIWRKSLENFWNNKDLAVADVAGDGKQVIVLADSTSGRSGLKFLDLRTGERALPPIPAPGGWGTIRGPILEDLDGDGALEILLALHRKAEDCPVSRDVGCREGALLVVPTEGSTAVWGGHFTFVHATETIYAGGEHEATPRTPPEPEPEPEEPLAEQAPPEPPEEEPDVPDPEAEPPVGEAPSANGSEEREPPDEVLPPPDARTPDVVPEDPVEVGEPQATPGLSALAALALAGVAALALRRR